MIKGNLNKAFPKTNKLVPGQATFSHNRMIWWDDLSIVSATILAELRNPEIVFASSRLVQWRGFEPAGVDKSGREILKYQEWFITQ